MPSEGFLRRMRDRDFATDEAAEPVETRERLAAVLLRSPRFGEVWLALDPCIVAELAAEESARADPRPVLLGAEIVRLRGRSEAAIRAALEVCRAWPGARVLQ